MDPILNITVERPTRARYVLTWGEDFAAGPVTVYAASDAAHFERSQPVAEPARDRVEFELTERSGRMYFLLVPESGQAVVVAERSVPFVGAVNFRDVGGYLSDHGRRVRWGRLFRSGHMANLTEEDKQDFAGLAISRVCDFRIVEEREREKTDLPGAPDVQVLGIVPGIGDKHFFHRLFASADDPAEVTKAVHEMLASLVRQAAPSYARLFEVLLECPPGAVLMNCSAGKERTGVATALVLSALGVPRETIMYDFMLSEKYFPAESEVPRVLKKYAVKVAGDAGKSLIMPLLETRRSYLAAAFDAIDEDFGSTSAFLLKHYGLDEGRLARLRDYYTE